MYFQVMIGTGGWLEQPVAQWAHTGALSQRCPELRQDGQKCPVSLGTQPELPSLFSESSAYSIERALEHAVLPSRLQSGNGNKNTPFLMLFIPCWCAVFLQGVLLLLPLLFLFTPLKFLFPRKITMEKVNVCCIL